MSENRPQDGSKPEPQVIELEAEEIKAEAEDTPGDAARSGPGATGIEAAGFGPAGDTVTPPPPPYVAVKRKSGMARWIIAALFASVIGGAWIYRDLLSGYLPTAEMTAIKTQLDGLEAKTKTMGDQLLAVSKAAADAKTTAASADGAIKSAITEVSGANSRVDGIETRIAAAEATLKAARTDLDSLNRTVAALGTPITATGTSTVDPAALAGLNQRIEAVEKDLASLKASSATSDAATLTTALSQALADLKAKVAAGASFQPEYNSIARMVPAATGLDVLAAHADLGLPAPAGLAKELRDTIPALPQPEAPQPSGGGYTDWLLESLSGMITIRTIGETNWPELAEKAAALTETGDLTQAIAAIDAAEGAMPQPLSQWRDRASARLSLEAAVGQVSEAVLRQIAAQGGVK